MTETEVAALGGAIVAGANFITMFLRSRSNNKYLDLALRVLNVVALNIGKNKNADDVQPS